MEAQQVKAFVFYMAPHTHSSVSSRLLGAPLLCQV